MILDLHQAETAPAMTIAAGTANTQQVTTFTVVTATDVFTSASAHGLQVNDMVRFTSTTTLPAPLVAGTDYYVKTVPSTTTFTISATKGGATLDITTTGTGTHTWYRSFTPYVNYPAGLGVNGAHFTNHASVSRPTNGQIWPRGDDYRRTPE
jgi:hypothetical protein